MKILKIFLFLIIALAPGMSWSSDLFFENETTQDGIDVRKVSNVFADIYETLDNVNWAGKNINVAIESLEKLNPKAHIAATGERAVLVWGDELIANYPYPESKDWNAYGQLTTALIMRMREKDSNLRSVPENSLYEVVVNALLSGIDENGYYIHSPEVIKEHDTKILTSLGFEAGRDDRGNLRITGVFKDSPSDNSGIREGDIVSEINGKRVSQISDAEVSAILSGYNAGTVKIKLLTPFGNRYVTLRRATIVLADADIIHRSGNETTGDILEIIVHKISEGAVNIVNEALAKYPDVSGIILDMRTTSGNDEKTAAKLAGLFIGQKPVMIVTETAFEELEVVPGGDAVTDVPVVVLVSNATQGTAEAVAASFYENKRGILVGTPTSGRSRIASQFGLKNGAMLELLNKSLKTGKGNILDGRGIFPLICLSTIRTSAEQNALFLNILNDEFNAHDYNQDKDVDVKSLRKACPSIVSGTDEDGLASAISVKILTDKNIYNNLMEK